MTLPPNATLLVHFKPGKPNRTLDLGARPPAKGSTKPGRWFKQAISGRTMHVSGDEAVRVAAAIDALPAKARADFNVQVVLERVAEVVADVVDVADEVIEVAGDAAALAAAAASGNVAGAVAAGAELVKDAGTLGKAVEAAVADDKGAKRRRRKAAGTTAGAED